MTMQPYHSDSEQLFPFDPEDTVDCNYCFKKIPDMGADKSFCSDQCLDAYKLREK